MAFEPSCDFQFQQRELHRCRALPRLTHQFVNGDRRGGQQAGYVGGFGLGQFGMLEVKLRDRLAEGRARAAVEAGEQFGDVFGRLNQHRAFADEMVAAVAARLQRVAGDDQ